jgi:hypothetical protein
LKLFWTFSWISSISVTSLFTALITW